MSGGCPIWGTPNKVFPSGLADITDCYSPRAGGRYIITHTATAKIQRWTEQENLLKAKLSRWIYEQNLLRTPQEITSQILKEVKHWPMPSVPKRMDYLLEFIDSKTTMLGKGVSMSEEMQAATLALSEEELRYLVKQAEEIGWIEVSIKALAGIGPIVITILGYQRLEELRAIQALSDQAFVAMWFDESMKEAWEKGFIPGIEGAGYNPFRIDRKQHNNKIDDEIIADIRRSRFLVADFTSEPEKARGGVYYEAGFAQGLNIPVIFTCRKDILDSDDIHFDTRQFNHIEWEEKKLEDLRENLKNRIAATIGDGPYRKNQKSA